MKGAAGEQECWATRKELFHPVASWLMAHLATQWTFVKGLGRNVAKDLRCMFWKLAHSCPREAAEIDMHEEGQGGSLQRGVDK